MNIMESGVLAELFEVGETNRRLHGAINHTIVYFNDTKPIFPMNLYADCENLVTLWFLYMYHHNDMMNVEFAHADGERLCGLIRMDNNSFWMYKRRISGGAVLTRTRRIDPSYYTFSDAENDSQLAAILPSYSPWLQDWYISHAPGGAHPPNEITFTPSSDVHSVLNLNGYSLSSSVFMKGEFSGALQTIFLLDYKQDLLGRHTQNECGRRFVITQDGYMQFSSHGATRGPDMDPLFWSDTRVDALIGRSIYALLDTTPFTAFSSTFALYDNRTAEFKNVHGRKYIVHISRQPSFHNLTLLYGSIMLEDYLFRPITTFNKAYTGAGAGIILCCIGIAIVFALCIAEPLRRASKRIRGISVLDPAALRDRPVSKVNFKEYQLIHKTLNQICFFIRQFVLYVPPRVVLLLLHNLPQTDERTMNLTITMSDIEGFSSYCERLPSNELATVMSSVYDAASQLCSEYNGWIIQYLGDAVFSSFPGAVTMENPHNPVHTMNAILFCLALNAALRDLYKNWAHIGLPQIRMRHGISAGSAVAGCVGNRIQMQYGVWGETVHEAKTLESEGKNLCTSDSAVLISNSVLATIGDSIPRDVMMIRWVAPVELQSTGQEMQAYQVLDVRTLPLDLHSLHEYRSLCELSMSMCLMWGTGEFMQLQEQCDVLLEVWGSDEFIAKALRYMRVKAQKELEIQARELHVGCGVSKDHHQHRLRDDQLWGSQPCKNSSEL